jgi:hypothetical protein
LPKEKKALTTAKCTLWNTLQPILPVKAHGAADSVNPISLKRVKTSTHKVQQQWLS